MVELNQNKNNENEKTIDEKFSEEEKNNIREIDELLNEDNEFIRIEQNSNRTVKIILSEKVQPVEKEYNEKQFIKYRFTVLDVRTGRVKKLEVGKLAARDIVDKLKEGYTEVNLERNGTGPNTRYIIRSVSKNSD